MKKDLNQALYNESYLTVKTLRETLVDLPDDLPVLIARAADDGWYIRSVLAFHLTNAATKPPELALVMEIKA